MVLPGGGIKRKLQRLNSLTVRAGGQSSTSSCRRPERPERGDQNKKEAEVLNLLCGGDRNNVCPSSHPQVSYIENRIAALNAAGMSGDRRKRVKMFLLLFDGFELL